MAEPEVERPSNGGGGGGGGGMEPTAVEICLAQAQRDLDDAEYHLGFVFEPLRKFVAGPSLAVGSKILPAVARAVPPLDGLISFGLGIPFGVSRGIWCATHSQRYVETRKSMHEMFDPEKARKMREESRRELSKRMALGDLRTQVGFAVQAVVAFMSNPIYNLGLWMEYMDRVTSYCASAGMEQKHVVILRDTFAINSRILGAVLREKENTAVRRKRIAIPGDPQVHSVATVAKMMRYCCASYGRPMMAGYDIIMDKYEPKLHEVPDYWSGGDSLKKRVAEHVGIPVGWIAHFHLGAGGDHGKLRYYISVDQVLGAIVFVLRGTFSVSEWMINLQGQSKPFMGGEAHSGMADLAVAIVEMARDELIEVLRENPGYKLAVTGQSLGGGLAPLVNILLHEDPDIGYREIECHAFAGPPVYHSESAPPTVAKAISNCTHYIFGDDIVPYLSLYQVMRTNAQLAALEKETTKMGFLHAIITASGHAPVGENLVRAALEGGEFVEPPTGSPKLFMPAKQIVWIMEDEDGDEINLVVCDPVEFGNLAPYFCGMTGIQHHVPQNYEFYLNKAERDGWRKVLH